MKRQIGFYGALLAAMLFLGCAAVETKDDVPAASTKSEELKPDTQSAAPSTPTPDMQSAAPSTPTPDTRSSASPPAPRHVPAPEIQKTETPAVAYLITTKNGCNVRSEPKEKSRRIATLNRGQKLQKIGQVEDWYNVILSSGKKGWIHNSLVKNMD